MKNLVLVLVLVFGMVFGGQAQNTFGEKIDASGAISTTTLVSKMKKKNELTTKVEGKVLSVCQKKGCWMNVDLGNGEEMRVTFKDYAFFMPKDLEGKRVVFQGTAKKKEISVDDLKHFAEDAGKSAEEINKITKPKNELTFEAAGVVIK